MEILLDAPNLGELEKEYLCRCIDSTFVSTVGPFVPEFEKKFADLIGIKYAISTQSGTSAIYMALRELGISSGDEVIVPVITFIATVNPIMYLGATPVFVDIDPKTWNIMPDLIEKAITPKTKAIMPVHLYGNPCDMDAIMEISRKHGIPVVEDATESLGASYKGKNTGTFGKYACFSFNGNKVITTAGGGMIVSNDEKATEHIRFLINQARDISRGYFHPEVGFNYRMTNLEASLGLAQFERLEEFVDKKKAFYQIYKESFEQCSKIEMQEETFGAHSSWWLSSIKIRSGKDLNQLQQDLKNQGIPTRRIFPPIVTFPPYQEYAKSEYPNAFELFETGLNLPSSTVNTQGMIITSAEKVKNAIKT